MTATAIIPSEAQQSGHLKVLRCAGFVAVSRLALMLARLRVIDVAKARPRIMPLRAVSKLSFVWGKSQSTGFRLAVTTTNSETERAAVKIIVRYFTVFGSEIMQPDENREFDLFADPVSQTEVQCFLCPQPVGACWAVVEMVRQTDERRIGIHGSLRPVAMPTNNPMPLNEALVGRQRFPLEHHLAEAEKIKDRHTAMQVLSRMIFLQRRASDLRQLRLIADIDQVFEDLSTRNAPVISKQIDVSKKTAEKPPYAKLYTTPFTNSLPLSKWLASEAIGLKRDFGAPSTASEIFISDGDNQALRSLTASYAGYAITIEHGGEEVRAETGTLPWVKNEELLSFLTGP